MAQPRDPAMPRRNETTATKVFIDPVVLQKVDETNPAGMSRTGWVNYLVQLGLGAINQRPDA